MRYYINIGTNLGDRKANIAKAVDALAHANGCIVAKTSESVQTKAWGYSSENTFMNMAVAVDSAVQPSEMLALLKRIEGTIGSTVHRDANGNYCDRMIDLDIMAMDEDVVDLPSLQIPHPHLAERYFFLKPFADIAPTWRHPVSHRTVSEMLQDL